MELTHGRTLLALGLGQFISLLLTGVAFSTSELARQGINAPILQCFFVYLLLAIVYGSIVLRRPNRCQVPWYVYLLLAFIDVEANYLAVCAYQYTSITSIMLLDCWTIPCVIFLTWLLLKTKYLPSHLIGIALCVTGLVLLVVSDVHSADRSGGNHPLFGDLLMLSAATLYGFTNVSEEFLVKTSDRIEFLAFIGVFGSLISACQLYFLEWNEVQSVQWTISAALPFISFAVFLFAFYTSVPVILQLSGSAMMNLSLLTSDMWAVAIRALLYHQTVDWLYFVAFAVVTIGLVVYSIKGDPALNEELARITNSYERIDSQTSAPAADEPTNVNFKLESNEDELEP